MKSLCGLSYVVLTFFGAINMKRVLAFLFAVSATLWMAAPAAAWNTLNDSEEPGSVIVFHRFQVGTVIAGTSGIQPATQFELGVTCPNGSICADSGQIVHMKAQWVCKGVDDFNASEPHGFCDETDFELQTTVHGTLVFNASGVQPTNVLTAAGTPAVPTPPSDCEEGYLIVWVVDKAGRPIKFDGLTGKAVVREFETEAHAYNALPIQATENVNTCTDTDSVGVCDTTDVNGDGNLAFDGSEYKAITGKIIGTIPYSKSGPGAVRTDLVLLTLDVHAGVVNPDTNVTFNFFNESEAVTSGNRSFACWTEFRPDEINFSLSADNPAWGAEGLVESTSARQNGTDVTLVGIVEVRESDFDEVTIPDIPVTLCRYLPILGYTCLSDVITATESVPIVRQYSYLLNNDSQPINTTYIPH